MTQGVTKRCRLSWLTNSALVFELKYEGRRGVAGSQPDAHGTHIKFGDLISYLTYGVIGRGSAQVSFLADGDNTE